MIQSGFTPSPDYTAARQSAVYFPQNEAGYLEITGVDRYAFLHRQSTNDIGLLQANQALLTVLTDPAARILDVLRVFMNDGALAALTLPGFAPATSTYLQSRIFFMDKVELIEQSYQVTQVDLEGPRAARLLPALGFDHAPAQDEFISSAGRFAIGQPGLSGTGYRVVAPAEHWTEMRDILHAQGAAHLTSAAHLVLRVEAGLPAAGSELTSAYTPLEVNLSNAIAENKGCYTGQEVIARQVTYSKVTQQLVGLHLEEPSQPGTRLWDAGKPVGTVTSVAESPSLGWIALAIVRKPHNVSGAKLHAGASPQNLEQIVTVQILPFKVPSGPL